MPRTPTRSGRTRRRSTSPPTRRRSGRRACSRRSTRSSSVRAAGRVCGRQHFDRAHNRMNPSLLKAGDWLHRRAENILAALLAVLFAAFIVQIVFRYFFNFPIGWTAELSVIAWLWLVMWAAGFVSKESEE